MTRAEYWEAVRAMREGVVVVVWDEEASLGKPVGPFGYIFRGTPRELVYRNADQFVADLHKKLGVSNVRIVAEDIPEGTHDSHLCERSFGYCYHHWTGDLCNHCGCTKEQAKTTYEFCVKKSVTPMPSCPQCPSVEPPSEDTSP
jgi:hypothetical protein